MRYTLIQNKREVVVSAIGKYPPGGAVLGLLFIAMGGVSGLLFTAFHGAHSWLIRRKANTPH